jgi:hypothetical protein
MGPECLDKLDLSVDPEGGCSGLVVESLFGGTEGGMEEEE